MSIQRLTAVTAVTLSVLGLAVAGWGPMTVSWFGVPASPVPDPGSAQSTGWWGLIGFVRLFGMTLLAMGAVLWIVRRSVSEIGALRFAATMAGVGQRRRPRPSRGAPSTALPRRAGGEAIGGAPEERRGAAVPRPERSR